MSVYGVWALFTGSGEPSEGSEEWESVTFRKV